MSDNMGKLARMITLYNEKGGSGKTASVVTISTLLALLNKKVLVIDLDQQGNTSQKFEVQEIYQPGDIVDFLYNNADFEEIVKHSKYGVDVLRNNARFEQHEDNHSEYHRLRGYDVDEGLYMLRDKLEPYLTRYDFVLVDTHPENNIWSRMSLVASKNVLIPVNPDGSSYMGFRKTYMLIEEIRQKYNPDLEILGVLLTRVKKRVVNHRLSVDKFDDFAGNYMLKSTIRSEQAMEDADSAYMPVYYYSAKTNSGTDYINACMEMGLINRDERDSLRKKYMTSNEPFVMPGYNS